MILSNDNPIFRENLLKRAAKLVSGAADVGVVGSYLKAAQTIEENGGYEIEGIATTDDVDCDDEVVMPEGLDWGTFNRYKTVYLDHYYGTENACATRRWVKRTGNGWLLRARMLKTCEETPKLLELAREQALGMSIGFVPTDRGTPSPEERKRYPKANSIVRKAMVFEVSLTSMPCNLACQTTAVYVDDSKAAKLADMATKGLIPVEWARRKRRRIVLV